MNTTHVGYLSIDALSALTLAHADRGPWRRWLDERASSFWREMYRELRVHAGDERLPFDLRSRLRTMAQRAFERSQRERAASRFPRTQLRAPVDMRLPEDVTQKARAAAERLGLRPGQPFVTADVRGREDPFHDSVAMLESRGYAVVRLPQTQPQSPGLDAYLLRSCAFLICDNAEAQRAAYVTNTPTLAVHAADAFAWYPIRQHGMFLLKTAIDLDTGRVLSPRELLAESYYRNLRNIGYRDNTSAQIRDAVSEMLEGLANGWRDSDGQARYRADAIAAGELLAPRVRHVARWGPVDGFIGDGRLARVQAESA